ncbi:DNA processing protein DprA [Mycolicibacter longobardus]|uniref:DNA processing protein DprA n=1 Tax=Mycolicibacter longobardus TaxID=1108812 RepID=A0A1X1YBJ3_9MYCO|nr:DNA processing protein DprA [Mycolicibacter longobardus]
MLRAWAYLSRVSDGPCSELVELARRVGPVEAAERVRKGEITEGLAAATDARRHTDHAAEDLAALERCGGRLIVRDDDEWPSQAFAVLDGEPGETGVQWVPPLALWAIGPARVDEITRRAVAVVGTRAATSYGEHLAADMAGGLTGAGVAVVAGGAYGIDGAAHRAALAADGTAVAVLAGGVDVAYPAGHAALLNRIGDRGLLVTEFAPGVRPTRYRFAARGRLVAALSSATVVVEAGARSGALNTACWARQLGRPVAAVPGPVTSAASAGCHALLRDGVLLAAGPRDVLDLLGPGGPTSG